MDGSIKNIKNLIAALEKLKKGEVLEKDSELYLECKEAFKKLQILDYFNPGDIQQILSELNNLPDELKEVEIGKLDADAKKLESKSLNKQDLESLMKDYEEATNKEVKKVYEQEIYKRTGKEDVQMFVKGQRELAEKNKKILEKIEKIDPKLKGEIETKLEKVEQGMEEVKAEKIKEVILEEKEYTKKELDKEIKNIVKEKEKAKEISKEVRRERAEIKVNKKADEIAWKTCEELKQNQILVTEEMRIELRENILKSWKEGEKLEVPESLTKVIHGEVILEKARKASENFKRDNPESIVNYRAEELGKEVSYKLRENGVKDEKLIADYVEVLQDLNYNSEKIVDETGREEIYNFVDNYINDEKKLNRTPGQIEASIDEAQFMAKNVVMAPKKFNKLVGDYNLLREKIGAEKLPKLKEIRVTEKMTAIFKNNPGILKIMNGAQKMAGFVERINAFPGNLLVKLGAKDAGLKILGKVGGQAAVDFVSNAAAIIAEQGTVQGIKSIALGIMGKGAVVAGGGATGGALAGAVAAFQALPVVGQVIAVAAAAVMLLKPVVDRVKKSMERVFGVDMNGVKNFLSDTLGLGKVVGGIGQFAVDIGTFLVGIPTLLGMASITTIVTPVVVFFFLGTFTYTMFQHNLVSSVVPPSDMGNCVLKSEASGGVNCDQNAPENTVAGVDKSNYIDVANRWKDGSNFASVCFNDTVNRALCAGINPTYALWVWLHESGASNYSISDVEDFGIHYIPENKDFNKQITEFLTLDPAKQCINDPRIGGDYWLAFSANFLNGSDCNPDRPNSITKMTPRQYAAEIREQWGWISSTAIPNGITVPKGGKNCDQIGNSTSTYAGNANEVTDSDGNVWICTENSQSPVGNYDPNAPGLSGVVVDGECSVGDVVVPTKQCDSQWGSVQLNGENGPNGKPGTICSSGCGPTSVSMLMRHVNGSLTPDHVIFNSGSAYANMGYNGSGFDQAKTELIKKFGGAAVTYDAVTLGCDEKAIAKWICDGKVVMVLANFYRNSNLEWGGHYVMAMGVKGGKIVVQDPFYDATNTPFDGTAAYGYAHDIKGCLLIDKNSVK